MSRRQSSQAGFTLVELIITTAILGILASVAIAQMRDYSRRASLSEAVLAVNKCKNMVTESYLVLDKAPDPGNWGCEAGAGGSSYTGPVQTSSNGVIRVEIQNLDRLVNGHHVYLVPAKISGTAMVTPQDLGNGVANWVCGSDWLVVRNALPSNCRDDTTSYSTQDFN